MNLDEWHAALERKLTESGLDRGKADPRVAWEVFRKLLAEPLHCDGGASITCRAETDYRGLREGFELRLGRLSAVDEGDFRMSMIRLTHVPEGAEGWERVKGLSCSVMQSLEFGGWDLLPLDEFLDKAYAEARFNAVLDHTGPWTAEVWIEDMSD